MIYFRSCPRCKGDVHLNSDSFGTFMSCLQCSHSRDLPSDSFAIGEAIERSHAEASTSDDGAAADAVARAS